MGALTTGGLEGVVAGRTAICTAEAAGDSLFYRGYDVAELAAQASYEEVACLLLYGELPNAAHLSDFRMRLAGARDLPPDLKSLLERLPAANVSSVGNKQVSLTGEDNAGNTTTVNCPYRVGYNFLGFLQPIPQSSYKAGSTIPVKFMLGNAAGSKISDAEAQGLVASCKVKVGLDIATGCASYNATTDTFQFDVKVPKNTSAGTHQIRAEISAPDGSGLVNAESVDATIRR